MANNLKYRLFVLSLLISGALSSLVLTRWADADIIQCKYRTDSTPYCQPKTYLPPTVKPSNYNNQNKYPYLPPPSNYYLQTLPRIYPSLDKKYQPVGQKPVLLNAPKPPYTLFGSPKSIPSNGQLFQQVGSYTKQSIVSPTIINLINFQSQPLTGFSVNSVSNTTNKTVKGAQSTTIIVVPNTVANRSSRDPQGSLPTGSTQQQYNISNGLNISEIIIPPVTNQIDNILLDGNQATTTTQNGIDPVSIADSSNSPSNLTQQYQILNVSTSTNSTPTPTTSPVSTSTPTPTPTTSQLNTDILNYTDIVITSIAPITLQSPLNLPTQFNPNSVFTIGNSSNNLVDSLSLPSPVSVPISQITPQVINQYTETSNPIIFAGETSSLLTGGVDVSNLLNTINSPLPSDLSMIQSRRTPALSPSDLAMIANLNPYLTLSNHGRSQPGGY